MDFPSWESKELGGKRDFSDHEVENQQFRGKYTLKDNEDHENYAHIL